MRRAILVIALLLASASLFGGTCSDPYLIVPGIQGELGGACQGAIDFTSAQWMGNTIVIVKLIDKASPKLMQACVKGQHFPEVTLRISAAIDYRFADATVSSYMVNGGGSQLTESVTLNFSNPRSSGPVGAAAPRKTPRELNVMGGARPGSATINFTNGQGPGRTATRWQLTVRGGGGSSASLQLAPPLTGAASAPMTPGAAPGAMLPAGASTQPASTLNCVELSMGGAPFARFVFQGAVPAQGGNLQLDRVQLQVPAGPQCGWQ